MSLRVPEFRDIAKVLDFLSELSGQGPAPTNNQTTNPLDAPFNAEFGFQQRSLLDGNVYQGRFAATQTAQTAAPVTATSPASELVRDPRVRAMLDVLGFAEGTGNNYGKVVNGTVLRSPNNPGLVGQRNVSISDFSEHPNILVQVRPGLNSTAAGRYQFLNRTWSGLNMPDFSPQSQDIAAVRLMQQRGMIEPLLRGDIQTAVFRGAPEWASLPRNAQNQGYYLGQSARTLNDILGVYTSSLNRQQGTTPAPATPTPTRPATPANPSAAAPSVSAVAIGRGAEGTAVRTLQSNLVRLGHLTQAQVNTGPGIFGPRTENAVKDFQRDNHLPVTGRWDAASRNAVQQILGVVERGDRSGIVRGAQQQLARAGFMTQAQINTGPGIFGPRTEAALRRFQAANDLVPDGKLGPLTYRALQNASAATPTEPNQPTPPVNGDVYSYRPWNMYSSGAGSVRRVTDYSQLSPHHDYQTVTRGGQRLEVRDVVLTRPGQNNNGQALPSPLEGRVVAAGRRGGYGNSIEVVNDRTGQRFLVGHLSRIDVRVGQTVRYGQTIGAQGSTGNSTGPHVHIEAQSSVIRNWFNDLVDGRFDRR